MLRPLNEIRPRTARRPPRAGCKLILWFSTAEEAVPPQQILGYTDRASRTFGTDIRDTFLRTFVVPGMHHCSRGEGAPTDTVPRMLEAAQPWVEDGSAPDDVTLSNETRTFLLCPYPSARCSQAVSRI